MPRDKKSVRLTPVDEAHSAPVPIRLENSNTPAKVVPIAAVRLGVPEFKEATDQRTYCPTVEVILHDSNSEPLELEKSWGDARSLASPLPKGWLLLIIIVAVSALGWSLHRVTQSQQLAEVIQKDSDSSLAQEQAAQAEARKTVDQIYQTLHSYFRARSPDEQLRWVRHPARVRPLMLHHYAEHPFAKETLQSITFLEPLMLDNCANFWRASVRLSDRRIQHLILESTGNREILVDWETLVNAQPMRWDRYAAERPAGSTMDFRVHVEPDNLFSHEFSDASQWRCFRLTALGNEEAMFGYVKIGSEQEKAMIARLKSQRRPPTPMILRLHIPHGLNSHRGVIIEKLVNPYWVYVKSPNAHTSP